MRTLRFIAVCVLLAGCGADKVSGPDVSFTGTYAVRTINGGALPYVLLQSGTSSLSLASAQFTIADGGSWSENTTFRSIQNGQTTTDVGANHGTWLRSGNTISLYSTVNNNTPFSGVLSSNQMTLFDGMLTYVLTK